MLQPRGVLPLRATGRKQEFPLGFIRFAFTDFPSPMPAPDGGGPKLRVAPGAQPPRKSWGPLISGARSPRIPGGAVSGGLGGSGGRGPSEWLTAKSRRVSQVLEGLACLVDFFENSSFCQGLANFCTAYEVGQKYALDHSGSLRLPPRAGQSSKPMAVRGLPVEPRPGPPGRVDGRSEGGHFQCFPRFP